MSELEKRYDAVGDAYRHWRVVRARYLSCPPGQEQLIAPLLRSVEQHLEHSEQQLAEFRTRSRAALAAA